MQVPRITQPQSIPVVGTDAQLPAVSLHRLQPDALREHFSGAQTSWTPEIQGDGRLQDVPTREASVLVPLVQRDDGLRVLLTRRTDHLHDHAGQISFPGGRRDPEDVDSVATALRETEEEIGLAREHIEILGQLPVYTTVTHYRVTPVVALVQPPFALTLDPFEVAEAFEVPLAFLMNPAHHRRHEVQFDLMTRQFLSMPWHEGEREYFIWGATAAMLRNLYGFLRHTPS
ncbi:MAG: CoA pyrophosphatase [Betaproteobacteria bacterium]|nr:CoA pyrophosphatase [Betaproteobacteria bacterium]